MSTRPASHSSPIPPLFNANLSLATGQEKDTAFELFPSDDIGISGSCFFAAHLTTSGRQANPIGRLLLLFQPFLAEGGTLYCIDGCNGFAPQLLALLQAQLGAAGLTGGKVLERVMVSRAYTAHQFVSAIKTLPISTGNSPLDAFLLVLGYDHLFYADDLPLWERHHLHRRGIQAMRRRHLEDDLSMFITLEQGERSPWCRELLHKYDWRNVLSRKDREGKIPYQNAVSNHNP